MKALYKITAATMAALALSGCGSDDDDDNDQEPAPLNLTILHINDHHSHLEPDSLDIELTSEQASAITARDGNNALLSNVELSATGGFPLLKTLIDEREAQAEHVLKLHAGDAISGTLFYTLFAGEADAAMMNQICFDAFALGNHEFDDGDSGLADFLTDLSSGSCNTPVLAANVVPAQDSALRNQEFLQPYTVIERGGERVGIIGIDIAGKTKNSSQPDAGTQFLDEATTAQRFIDELTEDGVNKIILLTHYQYANEVALARSLKGVDVIVGGDSHSLLGGDNITTMGLNVVGEYPTTVINADGDTACVVQAWEYAKVLGELTVQFDANGVVTSCAGQPIIPVANDAEIEYEFADDDDRLLEASDRAALLAALAQQPEVALIDADAATASLLQGFSDQTGQLTQQVIGSVAENLCLERIPGQGRSTLCDVADTYENGSDISNIVSKAFLTVTPTADVAIQNAGGVRVDAASGNYTIADAFTLLPFSNTLVTLEMTGAQIKSVLEDALTNFADNGGSSGSYPYASGLRYHVDMSQAAGSRISQLEINARLSGSWAAINSSTTYTVVTNDFIAAGRDGYTTFAGISNVVDTFTEYAQGFVDYVEGLTANNQSLQKLPLSEYSTQQYIDASGCNHSQNAGCGVQ
ncbi:NAD nucleotidase [Bacterioplanoides sp.]|uniref:NAD nucleotidase n=1 Tax=Bacterioplanoides sp. TaxID=2066072 RepID=UPI003B0029A6